MIAIDQLCYQSKLRYKNVYEKFAFAIATLLFCIVSRSFLIAGIALSVNAFLTVYCGKIPFSRYIKLFRIPLGFLFLSTFTIMIQISVTPEDLFALSVGRYFLTASSASFLRGLQLMTTALASVSCLYFLSLSTPMTDILEVLRLLHCPVLILELMLLIYRFIFILSDIASGLHHAQIARLGNKDYRTSLHSFASVCSAVFIRSIRKADRLYDALEARCYQGTLNVLHIHYPARAPEITAIILFELLLLAITLGRFY